MLPGRGAKSRAASGTAQLCRLTNLLFWNIVHTDKNLKTSVQYLKTGTFGILFAHA
jgi:hypothetical protein